MSGADDTMTPEERLAQILMLLPPAPAGWVAAAVALPATHRALQDIDGRVLDDAALRGRETAALEEALERAGLEFSREHLAALRRLLDDAGSS